MSHPKRMSFLYVQVQAQAVFVVVSVEMSLIHYEAMWSTGYTIIQVQNAGFAKGHLATGKYSTGTLKPTLVKEHSLATTVTSFS